MIWNKTIFKSKELIAGKIYSAITSGVEWIVKFNRMDGDRIYGDWIDYSGSKFYNAYITDYEELEFKEVDNNALFM